MKSQAARDGGEDAVNGFAQWDAATAAERAEVERKFIADSYGKHTVKVAQAFASPQAGGDRNPTEAEIGQRLTTLDKAGNVGAQREERALDMDLKRSNIDKNRADAVKAGRSVDDPSSANEYNKQISQIESTEAKLKAFVREHGGTIDSQGEITGMDAPLDLPGGNTASTAKAHTDLTVLGREFAGVINQGSEPNPDLLERVTPAMGQVSNGSLAASLKSMYQTLQQQKAGHAASVSPEVRARREGSAQSSSVERIRREQGAGPGASGPAPGIRER
jgi:hypothetical protein